MDTVTTAAAASNDILVRTPATTADLLRMCRLVGQAFVHPKPSQKIVDFLRANLRAIRAATEAMAQDRTMDKSIITSDALSILANAMNSRRGREWSIPGSLHADMLQTWVALASARPRLITVDNIPGPALVVAGQWSVVRLRAPDEARKYVEQHPKENFSSSGNTTTARAARTPGAAAAAHYHTFKMGTNLYNLRK